MSKAIDAIHCELAPHLESDTDVNISQEAGQLIDAILRGDFKRRDDCSVWVSGMSGVSSVMPACHFDQDVRYTI